MSYSRTATTRPTKRPSNPPTTRTGGSKPHPPRRPTTATTGSASTTESAAGATVAPQPTTISEHTLPMSDRAAEFAEIKNSLGTAIVDETPVSIVALGDSLELLNEIPDESVSLILCDPPYHSTQKNNIYGDRAFAEDRDFLSWLRQFADHWKRILKPSGTLYLFCSSRMASRLEVMLAGFFLPVSNVTWTKPNEPGYDGWKGKMKKEALRQWYPHSERILVMQQGSYGGHMATRRTPLGQYLRDCRRAAGVTANQLTEAIGAYGKVNHGGAVSNWETGRNIPSREQYQRIVSTLLNTGALRMMLDYDDIVRPFNVSNSVEFTDVWTFASVRPFKGKHPAEKPVDLLTHVVHASSYPDDIVLDCFAGSGSTGVAAVLLGRRTVCIELEEVWVKRAAKDIADAWMSAGMSSPGNSGPDSGAFQIERHTPQLPFTDDPE